MEQQISHFKILEEIGSGGMGVVYRARDQRLRRKVALKVLPAGALAEPTIRERLMREAQTTSAIEHPHIVTVFEIHSAGDRDFIAMEFVDGEALDRVIGEQGLPLDRALRFAIQIADGLACAHEHGVIHRDLKPQNVMITPSDDVKILDFGLAKRVLPTVATDSSIEPGLVTLTAPGVKVGTPAYMSPEQIESRPIDVRSDVFSFGCLLYQMLTGVSPFQRRNAILIFKAVLSDHPEPLRMVKPKLPVELERILSRALEKAPEKRYQDMRELLAELEAVHAQHFGTGIHAARSGMIPALAPPPRRGWRLPVGVASTLAVAALFWWLAGFLGRPPRLVGHRPIASLQGVQSQASLSLRGDRIAYVEHGTVGAPRLMVRSIDGGAPRQIPAPGLTPERPRWSPASPGLLAFGDRGGGVWEVDIEGGGSPRQRLERGSDAGWSPDGSRLIFERDGRIWTADAGGADQVPLESIPSAFFARWIARSPALSPDGREIVYFQPEVGPAGDLWVAPAGGGAPRRLLDRTFRGGDPAWMPDGRRIVFWADLTGEINLWCVPASGGEAMPLTHGPGRHLGPTISADGRHLLYTASNPTFALERRPVAGGPAQRLLAGRFEIVRPEVSPAGDRIAFFSPDGPGLHLFVMDAAGGEVRRVTDGSGERNVMPRWSADGTRLYYYQQRPSHSFREVAVAGGESRLVLPDWSWHRQYDTAVGPLGKRLVYVPVEAGALRPLVVRELSTGLEHELGVALLSPRWSADGVEVLGSDAEDRIRLCPAAGGDCRLLAEGFAARWGPRAGSITFARSDASPRDRIQTLSIWTLDLDTLEGSKLAEIETVGLLDLGYGFLAGGDLIWNRMDPGSEEPWLADFK